MTNLGNRRWWALGALTLAVLAVGLDGTVLSVALPTLASALHASESDLQWFSSGYLLVLAAAMLPAGLLGDRYGRKKVMLTSLILFGAGSVACAYAPWRLGQAGLASGHARALGGKGDFEIRLARDRAQASRHRALEGLGRGFLRRRFQFDVGGHQYSFRHFGAPRSGEPGIHKPDSWLWIAGPALRAVPEMTLT